MTNFLQKLTGLLQDPAPDFVFEVTESGLAWARPAAGTPPTFTPLEAGVLRVSPLTDNVQKIDALADAIRSITGGAARKRRSTVVILPDYSSRVAVLPFDQFPADPKEQLSLVR